MKANSTSPSDLVPIRRHLTRPRPSLARPRAASLILAAALMVASCCPSRNNSRAAACTSEGRNYVFISDSDTPDKIARKAACVVPSRRQYEWQRLELTAFVHFGLNTFTDQQWGSGKEDPEKFNPKAFDASQWARTLRDAGFRSLILTCKHHDGFCLWPSQFTDYDVSRSPWKNGQGDVVREVSEACRAYGLRFGIYLSPWDRHEQSYGTDEYNEFFLNQLTELLTGYGPICEVWFDGACGEGPNGKKQNYDTYRWYSLIRRLQPSAVIAVMGPDARWVGTENGIGRETEWSVIPNPNIDSLTLAEGFSPAADGAPGGNADDPIEGLSPAADGVPGRNAADPILMPNRDVRGADLGSREAIAGATALVWYPAETDVSIRPSWFYTDADNGRTKSDTTLMDIYFTSVGRNSNLLLNIPPNRDGLFGPDEVASLLQFSRLREQTFRTNHLQSAKIKPLRNARTACDTSFTTGPGCTGASGSACTGRTGASGTACTTRLSRRTAPLLCDGQYETSLAITSPTILFDFDKPLTVSILALQEDIRYGQRIEQFTLQFLAPDGLWHTITSGTTVGYKRLLRFDPVTATRFRLTITATRDTPVLSELGLY